MNRPYSINIDYSQARIAENRARQRAMWQRDYHNQVPVWLGIYARYVHQYRGVSYREYWNSPRDLLINQLENFKWIVENVDDDRWAEEEILLVPDFENIPNSAAMGCEIRWSDTEPPRALPFVEKPEDVSKLSSPKPIDGFWGQMIDWCAEMNELLDQGHVLVTRRGQPLRVHVTMGAYSLGPFSVAVDIVGPKFYEWLLVYPEICHQLLRVITTALIDLEKYCRQQDKFRTGGFNIAEDSAQIISRETFKTFCAPYLREIYEEFPGERIHHMCGRSQHLHQILLDDVGVTFFSGFGSVVPPGIIAQTMGGRALLRGNIDCVLLEKGTSAEVRTAARDCLDQLAPTGGYILCDGFNVAPGTPLQNLWILKEEAAAYGLPST